MCVCVCVCVYVCVCADLWNIYPDYYHNDAPCTSHNVGHINYALYPEDKVNFIVITIL